CKASALTEEGYELTLTFYGPGALYPVKCRQFHFCLEPALLFQAILPTSVWVLEPAAIEALIRTCPDFAVRAVDFHTMQGNLYLTRHMVSLQKDLCAKVAAFLYLYHSNSGGQSDLIPLSQNEVAAVLGISRVQVARAYRVLRGRQLLAPQRGGVRILDAEGLRACCPSFIVI
ncbi:MAG: Crp/Fnr family transcriptional regulator, partial [Butyricicoccaceae bacterium]